MPDLVAVVSPHGFGHAARAAAVLAELRRIRPGLSIGIWTTVPEWFFAESLGEGVGIREWVADVGLVQSGPLDEDPAATVAGLEELWSSGASERMAGDLRGAGAALVLADISPLALEAARGAALPAALLENFTWDWIYEGYLGVEPRLAPWVARLRASLETLALRIQAEPVCRSTEGAIRVGPIARSPRENTDEVRRRLGIAPGRAMVLVSLGGVRARFRNLDRWKRIAAEVDFVFPGGAEEARREENLVLLPHHSPVYHPDLVHAADAVAGKLGYSTVAEIDAAGTRVAYVRRPGFRESDVLERWVTERLPALEIPRGELEDGTWVDRIPDLLARPRPARPETGAPTGAEQAARALSEFIDSL